VVCNTADAHEVGAQITADCRKIRVHALPHVGVETRLTILRAKNDVENDFTYRLGHSVNDDRIGTKRESHFQRWHFGFHEPGAPPQAHVDAAPLALNTRTRLHAPTKPICLQHFSFTYSTLKFSS
jgi:hypothetical protein